MQLKMTIEDALRIVKDAARGMTIHEDSTGLRVAALVLAERVEGAGALVQKWRNHWSLQPQGSDKESASMGAGIELCADELEDCLEGKTTQVAS